MKKILNIMANRLFIVAVLILLQLGLIIGVMVSFVRVQAGQRPASVHQLLFNYLHRE